LAAAASHQPGDPPSFAGVGLFTGGSFGLSLLLGGAMLYMLLFMEEWLWDSRAYLARISYK